MKRLVLALAPLALSACLLAGPVGTVPPPPGAARPAGPINAGDAEAIALRVARDRGYSELKSEKIHHDEGQGGRWKVELRGLASGRSGKLDVRIADDGTVLDVKDHQKGDQEKDKDKDEKGNGKDKKDKHDDDDGGDHDDDD